jgi:hypothetical protein
VGAGPYWLRPFEGEVAQVYVRQREATASLPNIFTDGGLPVTVNLRYAYRLDPERMATDELYYSEAERRSQQELLMREVLLDLIQELSLPASGDAGQGDKQPGAQKDDKKDDEKLDVVKLFSPFAGAKLPSVRSSLKERMGKALLAHGIILTGAPVQIMGLVLPPDLSTLFSEFMGARFTSATRSEIIQRVRAAAPNMSENGLVQLLNIIQNPSAEIQTIFTSGVVNQDMLLDENGAVMRQRLSNAPQQPTPTQPAAAQPAPSQPSSSQPTPPAPAEQPPAPAEPPPAAVESAPRAAPAMPPPYQTPVDTLAQTDEEGADPDYPLVESDNVLLKSTRGS